MNDTLGLRPADDPADLLVEMHGALRNLFERGDCADSQRVAPSSICSSRADVLLIRVMHLVADGQPEAPQEVLALPGWDIIISFVARYGSDRGQTTSTFTKVADKLGIIHTLLSKAAQAFETRVAEKRLRNKTYIGRAVMSALRGQSGRYALPRELFKASGVSRRHWMAFVTELLWFEKIGLVCRMISRRPRGRMRAFYTLHEQGAQLCKRLRIHRLARKK